MTWLVTLLILFLIVISKVYSSTPFLFLFQQYSIYSFKTFTADYAHLSTQYGQNQQHNFFIDWLFVYYVLP